MSLPNELYIANSFPFRDLNGGGWHARHIRNAKHGHYLATSLCGIHTCSETTNIDWERLPPEEHCQDCEPLTIPDALPVAAYDLLRLISDGACPMKPSNRVLFELFKRDLIDGLSPCFVTELGWRWLGHCWRLPIFNSALRATR